MKKLLMLLLIVVLSSFVVNEQPYVLKSAEIVSTKYCDGFSDGFKEGYCYRERGNCLSPLAPLCPTPRLGEDWNDYKAGYNRGFLVGKAKRDNQ